jgi:ABC-type thiamin/hydroxymethylpyrimidine transport system permease subunit
MVKNNLLDCIQFWTKSWKNTYLTFKLISGIFYISQINKNITKNSIKTGVFSGISIKKAPKRGNL